jgi:hypothetical protein
MTDTPNAPTPTTQATGDWTMTATTNTLDFTAGDRVFFSNGNTRTHGTVTRVRQGVKTRYTDGRIVWVCLDESGRETWTHASSLTREVAS